LSVPIGVRPDADLYHWRSAPPYPLSLPNGSKVRASAKHLHVSSVPPRASTMDRETGRSSSVPAARQETPDLDHGKATQKPTAPNGSATVASDPKDISGRIQNGHF
jgi:hypothetical protein